MGHFTSVLTIPRYFYAATFLSDRSRLRTRLGSRPVNTFPRAIIAQPLSDYALAHFTYRNPKPPFSSDRRPSGRHDGFREKDAATFLFFLGTLIDRRKKKEPSRLRMDLKREKKKYESYYRKDITWNYSRAFVVFRSLPETL